MHLPGEELRFVVTTDDGAWVKSKGVFSGMLISEGNTPAQDMSINAACRFYARSLGCILQFSYSVKEDCET